MPPRVHGSSICPQGKQISISLHLEVSVCPAFTLFWIQPSLRAQSSSLMVILSRFFCKDEWWLLSSLHVQAETQSPYLMFIIFKMCFLILMHSIEHFLWSTEIFWGLHFAIAAAVEVPSSRLWLALRRNNQRAPGLHIHHILLIC